MTTVDQIERVYAMIKVRATHFFEHREDRHRRKVDLVPSVRRVYRAGFEKRTRAMGSSCQGPLGGSASIQADLES